MDTKSDSITVALENVQSYIDAKDTMVRSAKQIDLGFDRSF